MVRISTPILLLLAATAIAVPAGAAGPPIAYAKEAGSGFDLYLTNPDATGTIKLYSGPARNSLNVDMNPVVAGGVNELAITESRSTGFKIIRYSDAGVKQPVQTVPDACYIDSMDYHPSNGSLLVIRRCNNPQVQEIRIWSGGSYGSAIVSTDGMNDSYGFARWLGDGSGFLVMHLDVSSGAEIQRRNISNSSAPTPVWSTPNYTSFPSYVDTARCAGILDASCAKFLYTDQSGQTHSVTFDPANSSWTDHGVIVAGSEGHYSPDNASILYKARIKNGMELRISGVGARTLSTRSGLAGSDWRP
jgi:hypothetical protein